MHLEKAPEENGALPVLGLSKRNCGGAKVSRFKSIRCAMFASCAIAILPAQATSALAQQPRTAISVPSMPMDAALTALARQTGVNVLFLPDVVRGMRSAPIAGIRSVDEAAQQMIVGSPLDISRDQSGALTVRKRVVAPIRRIAAPAPIALRQAAPPPPAPAPVATAPATTDAHAGGLEEIVVTAQKRAENLQDTPISMAALTSADLANKGVNDINDLRSLVPSLQVTPHPNSATTSRIYIRGIGNIDDQITRDPSVAVYLDGVYVARSQGLSAEAADLERIEVLRGPQGSLYGRNATGGAINYITRPPTFDEFTFQQDFTVGNYEQFRSRSRANIPVSSNLAVELSYLHAQKNGFVKNLGTGVRRFGDQRRDAYRAGARWQPSASIDIRYSYDRSDMNDTPGFLAQVPFYPLKQKRPEAGSPAVKNLKRSDATVQGHNLTASFDIASGMTLKSITGYRKLSNTTYQDFLTGVFGPFPLLTNDSETKQKQFSQEFQLIGDALDGQLEYVLGAYYFDESATGIDITAVMRGIRTDSSVKIDNSAYALYGQFTWRPDFLSGLYITPSARWSRDSRRATLDQLIAPTGGPAVQQPRGRGDRDFSNVSPGLVVGYDVTDDVNAYVKYARGYKSGGYNIRASSIARFNDGFDEEVLDSYEVGLKSNWLDNRLRANISAFSSNYSDIQVSVQSNPQNFALYDILNAGKARIKGVEIDLAMRPTDGLTTTISYAYLDAKYKKVVDQITGNNIADRFNFIEAPRHTIKSSIQYEIYRTKFGILTGYLDYFLQSKKKTAVLDRRFVIGDYSLLDARLSLSDIPLGPTEMRISLWGKNLSNENYYLLHGNAGVPQATFGSPRTFGLDLGISF